MRRALFALMALLLAAVGLVAAEVGTISTASAAGKLPVPYTFLPSAIVGGLPPGVDAPGTNDWTRRPSAAHPQPVVLVHGTIGNKATNWPTYGPLLANEGYCVYALTYGALGDDPVQSTFGGLGRMQDSARQLKAFVARVLASTGARKVDLVGHSQGTLMPSWYLQRLGGADKVRNYVSLAPLWHGTKVAAIADVVGPVFGLDPDEAVPVCVACGQFAPGSRFMAQIREGGPAVRGVRYTNIVTRYDELVVPYTSGIEPGMRNVVLQDRCATDFSEHFQIVSSPVAAQIVLNTLDPQRKKPVVCSLVLPFVGSPGA